MKAIVPLLLGESRTIRALRRNSDSIVKTISMGLNKTDVLFHLNRLMENNRTMEKMETMIRKRIRLTDTDALVIGNDEVYVNKIGVAG